MNRKIIISEGLVTNKNYKVVPNCIDGTYWFSLPVSLQNDIHCSNNICKVVSHDQIHLGFYNITVDKPMTVVQSNFVINLKLDRAEKKTFKRIGLCKVNFLYL